MRTEPAWAMMAFPTDLAATQAEIDARVAPQRFTKCRTGPRKA